MSVNGNLFPIYQDLKSKYLDCKNYALPLSKNYAFSHRAVGESIVSCFLRILWLTDKHSRVILERLCFTGMQSCDFEESAATSAMPDTSVSELAASVRRSRSWLYAPA